MITPISQTKQKFPLKNAHQIIIVSILTFLTVLSVTILHSNQTEFVQLRFNISINLASLFDTVLYLAYLIVGIIIGVVSDRLGKRKIFILVGSTGSAIFFYLMTIAPNYIILLTFRFLQGSFTVLTWQVLMTLIFDFSSPQDRGKNVGILGIFLALSMGLGPVLGGYLAKYGVNHPYYLSVLLQILVFIFSIWILKEPTELAKTTSIKHTLSIVKEKPFIIVPSIFNFIDRLHMGFLLFILPYFIVEKLGLDPSKRGMALGIFATPFILLQYPIGKLSDKIGRYSLLFVGSIGYGFSLALVGLIGQKSYRALLLILIFLGIFSGFTSPTNMALVGDNFQEEKKAMGMAFFNLFGNIGIFIGPIIGGFLIYYYNYTIIFIIAALIEWIFLIANIILIKKLKNKKPRDIFYMGEFL